MTATDEIRALLDELRAGGGGRMSESFAERYTNCLSRVEAENAELRELARDMWNGMCGYGHDCRSCEHYELYAGHRFVGECEYHRRMRELGIEVNG